MPLFPIVPLLMWGASWLINRWFSPWGTRGVLWLHGGILVLSLAIIVRDILRLRAITKMGAEQSAAPLPSAPRAGPSEGAR